MFYLRSQSLEALVHDPLVEWKLKSKRDNAVANDIGRPGDDDLRTIETKLIGLPHRSRIVEDSRSSAAAARNADDRLAAERGLPLSCEGVVARQIEMALDVNNLCRMYFGWASFI